jgi:hypothetical protein
MLVTNLRHYLGEDLSLIKLPREAAGLREYLGCITEAVTSRVPHDQNYGTELNCRMGCGENGIVVAYFDNSVPRIIHWYCTCCDDKGQLTGWEDTIWDKRSEK